MAEKFQNQCPIDYFKRFSADTLEMCHKLFLNEQIDLEHVFISDASPTPNDMLLQILSSADVYFGSKVFRKVDASWKEPEILKNASSPLPSVFIGGT